MSDPPAEVLRWGEGAHEGASSYTHATLVLFSVYEEGGRIRLLLISNTKKGCGRAVVTFCTCIDYSDGEASLMIILLLFLSFDYRETDSTLNEIWLS